ncbi:MAG TPA: hypothetical protein VJC11_04030 [Patescibacteria group bacterium]|nr:hypothetical protein [Patescibacteria group bacterium]
MVSLFKKMKDVVATKVQEHRGGLYIAILFPISFSFLLTFAGSRLFSHYFPQFYVEWVPGLHVHHFTYGFFILAAAGYLALVHNGPRASYWIALLFGMGLGFSMDEFGMWLRFRDDDIARWSYDGLIVVILITLTILFAKPGIRFFRYIWPFRKN